MDVPMVILIAVLRFLSFLEYKKKEYQGISCDWDMYRLPLYKRWKGLLRHVHISGFRADVSGNDNFHRKKTQNRKTI